MSGFEQINIKRETLEDDYTHVTNNYTFDIEIKEESIENDYNPRRPCSTVVKKENKGGAEDETKNIAKQKPPDTHKIEIDPLEEHNEATCKVDVKIEQMDNVRVTNVGDEKETKGGDKADNSKSEDPGKFPCHICGAKFDDMSKVTEHLNDHVRRFYKCQHCTCIFHSELDLDTHQLIHNTDPLVSDELYNCDVCGEKLPTQLLLKAHKNEHKDDKGLPCHICGAKLKTKYILKSHIENHATISFTCKQCGKKCTSAWSFKQHMKFHSGLGVPCTLCKKEFPSQSKLDSHMTSHTGEKPFDCKICFQKFARNSTLKVHMRLHTGQKDFICDVCERAFRSQSLLASHKKIHVADRPKPFKCPDCDDTFVRNIQLKRHYVNIHSTDTPFSCEACNAKFKNKSSWKYHTMTQHSKEKPHKCNICGKGFLINNLLERHMWSHTGEQPYPCEHCDKRFRCRSNMRKHVITVHKKIEKGKD